jgi:hypothetical protein
MWFNCGISGLRTPGLYLEMPGARMPVKVYNLATLHSKAMGYITQTDSNESGCKDKTGMGRIKSLSILSCPS